MTPSVGYEPKHYRMKAETGFIGVGFNHIQVFSQVPKRFYLKIPGFKNFGFKNIQLTEVETGKLIFRGRGFTIFGVTRCNLPKTVQNRISTTIKYKISIQK